jgi:hypothetical protein
LTNQDGQLLLELDTKLLANVKKVILIDEYDYWLPLDLPKSEAKPVPPLAFAEGSPPVRQNDEVGLAITGPKAAEVATILAAGKELQKLYVPKPESLTIYLTTEQTDKPRNLTLQFFDKDRKKITDLSLEIIARPKSEQPKPATTAAKSAKKGE